jgi:hypothetical protein
MRLLLRLRDGCTGRRLAIREDGGAKQGIQLLSLHVDGSGAAGIQWTWSAPQNGTNLEGQPSSGRGGVGIEEVRVLLGIRIKRLVVGAVTGLQSALAFKPDSRNSLTHASHCSFAQFCLVQSHWLWIACSKKCSRRDQGGARWGVCGLKRKNAVDRRCRILRHASPCLPALPEPGYLR